ncbi:hypothetical protein LCGC14_2772120 [marine sediment metagenome]|uniref:Uncharacterized protein n=1 Tax=marine sediment metagenome TaxID=412755 RepID=A0A0F9BMF9_9ZZZZ
MNREEKGKEQLNRLMSATVKLASRLDSQALRCFNIVTQLEESYDIIHIGYVDVGSKVNFSGAEVDANPTPDKLENLVKARCVGGLYSVIDHCIDELKKLGVNYEQG